MDYDIIILGASFIEVSCTLTHGDTLASIMTWQDNYNERGKMKSVYIVLRAMKTVESCMVVESFIYQTASNSAPQL